MEATIGIDVSKVHLDVTIRWAADRMVHRQFVYTKTGQDQLIRWLMKQEVIGAKVCMEATGRYSVPIATRLHEAGCHVSIENPMRIKHFVKSLMMRVKTDKADATALAYFAAVMSPKQWFPPSLTFQNIQDLKRLIDDLDQDRTRTLNRLEGMRANSPARPYLERQLKHIEKQLERVQQELSQQVDQDDKFRDQCKLLKTIKGIGEISAQQLLAEIPDWTVFGSADALVAYAGLNPAIRQSGKFKGKSRLSKCGNAHIRKSLYFPALTAMQHNPQLRAFAQRLKDSGKEKMVIVAAVMRKLLVLAYAIMKSGQPYDPNYPIAA